MSTTGSPKYIYITLARHEATADRALGRLSMVAEFFAPPPHAQLSWAPWGARAAASAVVDAT